MSLSSPDPLSMSNENLPTPSPIKPDRPIITPRKVLAETSGNACVQEFYLTTPPARKARPTPTKSPKSRTNTPSPWRIRLTLSAEQADDMRVQSPTKRIGERTTTIKVPLKDADDTPPAAARKGRGRPRKSLDTTEKNSIERHGTPKPKVSSRRKTVTKLVTQNTADSNATPPSKKSRGKAKQSRNPNCQSAQLEGDNSSREREGKIIEAARETRPRSKGRRREITPIKKVQDADSEVSLDDSDAGVLDPTDEHQEFDTILESEGFSMLSVSSLPSTGNHSSHSVEQEGGPVRRVTSQAEHRSTPNITTPPSVPPALKNTQLHSSPRLSTKSPDGTPRLARVVRAGIALQGVLSPKDRVLKLGSPFSGTKQPSSLSIADSTARGQSPSSQRAPLPRERLDKLFSDFGPSTRRELKAGLRLGEELAKRQQKDLNKQVIERLSAGSEPEIDPICPQLPGSNHSDSKEGDAESVQVDYPSLPNHQLPSPSPERSEVDPDENRINMKGAAPVETEDVFLPTVAASPLSRPNISIIDHTMIAREAEWQRERAAVSRQIEAANKSQIIVIDSDEEEENQEIDGQDESDIWQAEAHSDDNTRGLNSESSNVLLQPEVVKPRRTKLPSSWRRGSQVIYSDELNSAEPDLFWQPNRAQAQASKERSATKFLDRKQLETPSSSLFEISHDASNHVLVDNETLEATLEECPPVLPVRATGAAPVDCSAQQQGPLDAATITTDQNDKDSENNDRTLLSPESKSAEIALSSNKKDKVAIDPLLLQKKHHPQAISLKPTETTSTSWLGRLAGPIWRVFTPAAPLPPPATREDILCSSPHEPLCQFTPWEECHFRALGPLYYASLLYGSHLFPFNKSSPSARFCGATIITSLGWSRTITPADCGITDAFMVLLDERGYALGEPGEQWIDESLVVSMCVVLWVGMVMRGEVEPDKAKGEKVGLRKQEDRVWTREDINWANNESEYFERKRREFDGLPSWKVMKRNMS